MPAIADREMREKLLSWKIVKDNPLFTEQIKNANQRNVDDGRELMLANCWFCDVNESAEMWKAYAEGVESVAITSTVGRLSEHVLCDPQFSLLGRVQYVDHASYKMSHYEANQAGERALLKDNSFSREKEVRMVTMSVKGPMCVNEDGTDMVPPQYEGAHMNNFENSGLYIKADLPRLVMQTVLAPQAPKWFELLVKRIAQLSGVGTAVARSQLE